jgi:hypothetical protein
VDKLLEIARNLSREFGISAITIGFRQKKQIWSARLNQGTLLISFTPRVKDFPEEIQYALIFTLLARLKRQTQTQEYKNQSAFFMKFLKDQADAESQKLVAAQRQKCNPRGNTYNLESQLQEVISSFPNLFHEVSLNSEIFVTWGKRTTYRRFGLWHSQSRVIEISKTLDSPLVPEFVVNFILYHELLHVKRGVKKGKRHHDAQFRILEKKYPQYKEANEFLRNIHKNRGILPP